MNIAVQITKIYFKVNNEYVMYFSLALANKPEK